MLAQVVPPALPAGVQTGAVSKCASLHPGRSRYVPQGDFFCDLRPVCHYGSFHPILPCASASGANLGASSRFASRAPCDLLQAPRSGLRNSPPTGDHAIRRSRPRSEHPQADGYPHQAQTRAIRAAPGHGHIILPSAAFGTDQLLAPIERRRFGAVPSRHLDGIGLDPSLISLSQPVPDRLSGRCELAQQRLRGAPGLHRINHLSSEFRRIGSATFRDEQEKKGQPAKLAIGEPMPDQVEVLPRPDALAGQCCSVAPFPEGEGVSERSPTNASAGSTEDGAFSDAAE